MMLNKTAASGMMPVTLLISVILLSGASFAQTAPASEPKHNRTSLIDFNEDTATKAALFKEYVSLFDQTERMFDSQRRYFSWCCKDSNAGPSKADRYTRGLYSVFKNVSLPNTGQLSAEGDPQIRRGNVLAKALVESYATAFPLVNKTYQYYNAKGFELDEFEGARELHRQLSPALNQFNDAYRELARFVLSNLENYQNRRLSGLLTSDKDRWVFERAYLSYKNYTLRKRTGFTRDQLQPLLTEVHLKVLELKAAGLKLDGVSQLVSSAQSAYQSCSGNASGDRCETNPFD